MKPLVLIYWIRVALGIIAGALTAVLAVTFGLSTETAPTTLINCLTAALLIYLISYYVLKAKFKTVIERQSKILSQGIGMYFFTWISFLVLFYTIIRTILYPGSP